MDAGNSLTDGNRARDVVSPDELDRELERILVSQAFARSRRLQDLLRYTVERIKTGRADTIKEYLLAVEVFDRKPSFDPRFDSIVRVQASRLREKLVKYYATEGREDDILIAVPKGAYIPTVQRRQRPPSAYQRRWVWGAVAALFSGAVLWLAILQLQTPGRHSPVLRRLTSDAGFSGYPAVSQDGKWIAFASDRGGGGPFAVWVTPATDSSAARRLTDDDANDYEPAFSPDNRHIVYRSDRSGGGIYIIPVAGGQSRLIAARGRRPRFSPDGSRIAYWERDENLGTGPNLHRAIDRRRSHRAGSRFRRCPLPDLVSGRLGSPVLRYAQSGSANGGSRLVGAPSFFWRGSKNRCRGRALARGAARRAPPCRILGGYPRRSRRVGRGTHCLLDAAWETARTSGNSGLRPIGESPRCRGA